MILNLRYERGMQACHRRDLKTAAAGEGTPLETELLIDHFEDQLDKFGRRVHVVHALSLNDQSYFGCYVVRPTSHVPREVEWLFGVSNDEKSSMINAGFYVKGYEAIGFHTSGKAHTRRGGSSSQLESEIAFNLKFLKEMCILHEERFQVLTSKPLDRLNAHDLICTALASDLLSAPLASDVLMRWHRPTEYIRPRTAWSLYVLICKAMNTWTIGRMIQNTILLCDMFDKFAGFVKRRSIWVQPDFFETETTNQTKAA